MTEEQANELISSNDAIKANALEANKHLENIERLLSELVRLLRNDSDKG